MAGNAHQELEGSYDTGLSEWRTLTGRDQLPSLLHKSGAKAAKFPGSDQARVIEHVMQNCSLGRWKHRSVRCPYAPFQLAGLLRNTNTKNTNPAVDLSEYRETVGWAMH